MNYYDALNECCKTCGTSLRKLSVKLGHRENYISNMRSMSRITSIENAIRMFNACDCGLYAIPRDKAPADAVEITLE